MFPVAADFEDSDTSDTLTYTLGAVTGPVPEAVMLASDTNMGDDRQYSNGGHVQHPGGGDRRRHA